VVGGLVLTTYAMARLAGANLKDVRHVSPESIEADLMGDGDGQEFQQQSRRG